MRGARVEGNRRTTAGGGVRRGGGGGGARVTRGGATLRRRDLDTAYAQLVTFYVGPILNDHNKINESLKKLKCLT